MVINFSEQKALHDEAKSRAEKLNNYVLDKCDHNEAMKSFIENPKFQRELVKALKGKSENDT